MATLNTLRIGRLTGVGMNIIRLVVAILIVAGVDACAGEARYPPNQKSFIGDVLSARGEYVNAKNQVVQGHVRVHRQKSLSVYSSQTIENWIGCVYQMSTLSDGSRACIRVQIDPHIMVSTANNDWDSASSSTLIPYQSDLYRELLSFGKEEWVVFSGRFVPSSADGIRELSLTMHGSMTDPEFLFKFTNIKRINRDDIKPDSIFGARTW